MKNHGITGMVLSANKTLGHFIHNTVFAQRVLNHIHDLSHTSIFISMEMLT